MRWNICGARASGNGRGPSTRPGRCVKLLPASGEGPRRAEGRVTGPTYQRTAFLATLAKCSDEELQSKSSQLAGSVKVQEDATGVVSIGPRAPTRGDMDTGDDTVVLPPPAPSNKESAHEARGHRLYAQVETITRTETAPRDAARGRQEVGLTGRRDGGGAAQYDQDHVDLVVRLGTRGGFSSIAMRWVVLGVSPSPSSLGSETRSPWTVLLMRN